MRQDPLIIYGAPRSGTTYLRAIIDAHPAANITNETRVFTWLHRSLRAAEHPKALLLHRDRLLHRIRETMATMVRDFYRDLDPEAEVWGDKNPHYASHDDEGTLETIDSLFPGSRFIHIIRDGRDVVTSLIRKRKPDGTPWIGFDAAHRAWIDHVEIGSAFGRRLPAGRYFELRYEDLVEDDLGWATKVLEFAGLGLHPVVTQLVARQADQRTPLSGPTRDLDADPAGSDWEQVLSPEEQDRSLELIGDALARFGYGL